MNCSRIARRLGVALCIASAALALPARAGPDASALQRVSAAVRLVEQLDLANTDYAHGQGSVTWTGVVASHTDCSGFVDHLLMHVDGYSPDDFKRWFGSHRPTAERYHDAIIEGRGFVAVAAVGDLQPGDVIAVKYLNRRDNTGHIMMVVNAPTRMVAAKPFVMGSEQWAVDVIDSSESGHGPMDTRHKQGIGGHDHDGLGRGVFRLYAGAHGEVTGFSWSTAAASRFIAPDDEHVVLGRFIPHFQP
jgi:hypothetical protein